MINTFTLFGEVAKDAEFKRYQNRDGGFVHFYVATEKVTHNEPKKEYFEVCYFGDDCNGVIAKVKKGSKISVSGKICSNSFTGQNGKSYLNYSLMAYEIITDFEVLKQPAFKAPEQSYNDEPHPQFDISADDLPF